MLEKAPLIRFCLIEDGYRFALWTEMSAADANRQIWIEIASIYPISTGFLRLA